MKHIRDLLSGKNREVITVSPEVTTLAAIQTMIGKGIGALLVVNGERMLGIVTERDFLRKVSAWRQACETDPVSKIMTEKPFFVTPEMTIEECMQLMTEKRIRHLPVMDSHKLIGIISIGDVLKSLISEKNLLIKNFETYIAEG